MSATIDEALAALHASSRGTQACITAANTVSGIIGDLETTILFATSGTLNQATNGARAPADVGEHRTAIIKTAQALMEDTKALVTGAASNQVANFAATSASLAIVCLLTADGRPLARARNAIRLPPHLPFCL